MFKKISNKIVNSLKANITKNVSQSVIFTNNQDVTKTTLVFHHALKTGGTSFSNWMTSVLGSKNILHINEADEDKIKNFDKSKLKKFKGIHGHGSFHSIKYINNVCNITIVRDPISFALSRYVFDREYKIKNSLNNLQSVVGEVKISEFYENLINWCKGPVFNTYPKMYTQSAFSINSNLSKKYFNPKLPINRVLNKLPLNDRIMVCEEIMNSYDVVWTSENISMLCFILAKTFKLKLDPILHSNSTNSKKYYLSNEVKKEILKYSSFNKIIYDIAIKKMDIIVDSFFDENPQFYIEYLDYLKQNQ